MKKELQQAVRWEEKLIFQKTRQKWISEGDNNSKFFHALIWGRRSRNKVQLHGSEDSIITEPKTIGEMAVVHFRDIFSASNYHLTEELFDDFSAQVTNEMDTGICQIPSEK